MVTSFYITMTLGLACSQRAVVYFYLFHGLVQVCEIELSHVGKINGNPDLVCEKSLSDTP